MLLRQFANLHSDKKQISVGFVGYLFLPPPPPLFPFIHSPPTLFTPPPLFFFDKNHIPQRRQKLDHQHPAQQESVQGRPYSWRDQDLAVHLHDT